MREPFIRVSRNNPCPICKKPDWCAYNGRIAICMRIQSPVPSRNGGWVHKLKLGIEVPKPPEKKGIDRRDDVVLDRVYRKLLTLLPLHPSHYQHLKDRGMTDEEIVRFGYRTLPATGRDKIVSYFDPKEVEGVPGFGIRRGQLTLAGSPGLIIPVMSPEKKIVSLVIRPDEQRPGRKYIVLSSAWLEKGASPGARLHLAIPEKVTTDTLWITEGPLKANISATRLKAKILAVPGVASWGEILNLNLPKRVVLAYDSDYENFHVRYHARKLANALLDKGIDLKAALWEGYKGLDDALVGGANIRLVRVTKKPLPKASEDLSR